MEKIITASSLDNFYIFEGLQSHGLANSFHKTANPFPEEITEMISNIKPSKTSIFVVIAPMGVGEYWGSNVNGDYFPEKALKDCGNYPGFGEYGHKTFLKANLFRHHINKDPNIGFGKIISSCMDEAMKRVVVIAEVDRDRARRFGAGEFLKVLDDGGLPEVSMGCHVPFDTCSICGNRAKNRLTYCEHLQPENMLREFGDKIAYAINDYPKFFDLSFVHKGADRSSGTLQKIASLQNKVSENFFIPSALHADIIKTEEEKILQKKADSFSNVLLKYASTKNKVTSLLCSGRKELSTVRIPKYILSKLAEEELNVSIPTAISMGIPLHDSEIQFLSIYRNYGQKLASSIYDSGVVFERPRELSNVENLEFSKRSFDILSEVIPHKSLIFPFFEERVICGFSEEPFPSKSASEISSADAAKISMSTAMAYSVLNSLLNKSTQKLSTKEAAALSFILNYISSSFFGGRVTPSLDQYIKLDIPHKKQSSDIWNELGGSKGLLALTMIASSLIANSQLQKKRREKAERFGYEMPPGFLETITDNYPKSLAALILTVGTPGGRKLLKSTNFFPEKKLAKDDRIELWRSVISVGNARTEIEEEVLKNLKEK